MVASSDEFSGKVLPRIRVEEGKLPEIVDEAERALSAAGYARLYQRGGDIVRLVRTPEKQTIDGVTRDKNTLQISSVNAISLREVFSSVAWWEKHDGRAKEWRTIDCPPLVAQTYLSRGEWKLPVLQGIVEAPTLRPDGSVLDQSGYDPVTGLHLELDPSLEWGTAPDKPSKTEAASALSVLKEPLAEFPFLSDADRSVALAAILTSLVRRSLRSAPLFGFDAPERGSGKSLLADIVSMITLGRDAPATPQPSQREEWDKMLLSILRRGDPIVSIDNIERPVRSASLCSVLTQAIFKARILGRSVTVSVPTTATFLATGNNLTFAGDMATRALVCRIEPGVEHPEKRKFRQDLRRVIPERRAELVAAGLTILRAYHVVGRPKQRIESFGRFEDWSNWVRSALVWLGEPDPCATRKRIEEEDPERARLAAVLETWWRQFEDEPQVVASVMKFVQETPDRPLAIALAEAAGDWRGNLHPKPLGEWLRRKAGAIVNGHRFVRAGELKSKKVARWAVEKMKTRTGTTGSPGTGSSRSAENSAEVKSDGEGGNSPVRPRGPGRKRARPTFGSKRNG